MKYELINYYPYFDNYNYYRNYSYDNYGWRFNHLADIDEIVNDLMDVEDYYINNSKVNNQKTVKKTFTTEEATQIAQRLGIDFSKEPFDLEQFRMGLDIELEHGNINPETNISNDDPIITGKIALAHLHEIPDYYTRLKNLESTAKVYWSTRLRKIK